VDLILDPERGLALGILALGGEPLLGEEPFAAGDRRRGGELRDYRAGARS
jgi:hypothetical protein